MAKAPKSSKTPKPSSKSKTPIIIDTDPGIDDALAIALALFSPHLEVRLITTVAGNVALKKTTLNALKLLEFYSSVASAQDEPLGKYIYNIPVAAGAFQPLLEPYVSASEVHGESGLGGYEFDTPRKTPLKLHAVEAMREELERAIRHDEKITLVPIGPLTNIALLLATYPHIKPGIKEIVLMGGSLGRGNLKPLGEFNIALDPEAAAIIFSHGDVGSENGSGLRLTMVGLDIADMARLVASDLREIARAGRIGEMAYALFMHYRSGQVGEVDEASEVESNFDSTNNASSNDKPHEFHSTPCASLDDNSHEINSTKGLAIYDATAICYLVHPEFFSVKECLVGIELGGMARGASVVYTDSATKGLGKRPNAFVPVKIDGAKFRRYMVEAIGQMG